jgi:hypothetical protein
MCGHDRFITAARTDAIACGDCGFVCTRHEAMVVGECINFPALAGAWPEPAAVARTGAAAGGRHHAHALRVRRSRSTA